MIPENKKNPLPRKKIYVVFFVMVMIMAFVRAFLFPRHDFFFQASLTAISFACFMIVWENILWMGAFLERKFPQSNKLYVKFIIQVSVTYALTLIISTWVQNLVINGFHSPVPPNLIVFGLLLCFMLSVVMNLIYFGSVYFNEWKDNIVRTAILQHEKAQVKYDSLKNQLNPHFLFNALTSLNSLIFENQQLASDFLQQLSKVYRYTLQNKDKENVTLKTECEFISNYISLFKTRFQNSIQFKMEICEEAKEKGIVPVTLQMLIENAAKHNVISDAAPLMISIIADKDYLRVENSVNKKSQVETSNKQGLVNLKTLYQYLSDKPIEIIETEKLYTVKIPLIEK